MGFEFRKQDSVEICGRRYALDISSLEFIGAVTEDFAAILSKYNVFQQLQNDCMKPGMTKEDMEAATKQLIEENQNIAELGRDFIIRALGKDAYEQIFAGRAPSSVDHIELCAYIYREAMRQRQALVKSYVNKNRRERRAAARAAKKSGGFREGL